ncbi:heme-binding protein [Brucella pseudogrignonensis]|uniref:GlcG/HbpS family heme-binding protein n=1 Tax=Brucella pseudogrignonensis TaxID=419475 RepID=UPI0028B97C5B|nr:heme-binding protein [Brucella pseudogrignonensis]MDT6942542.1 heme-binding protein [Brucella pseudogrignonensis]
MSDPYINIVVLSHSGAFKALSAAVAKAEEINVPQCICIVDPSGETIVSFRMDGAKYLSMQTARSKARTAASIRNRTGGMPADFAVSAGIATNGGIINLPGGLPIKFDGKLAGAIGIGSGTGEQDIDVARAALAALGADAVD